MKKYIDCQCKRVNMFFEEDYESLKAKDSLMKRYPELKNIEKTVPSKKEFVQKLTLAMKF